MSWSASANKSGAASKVFAEYTQAGEPKMGLETCHQLYISQRLYPITRSAFVKTDIVVWARLFEQLIVRLAIRSK